MMIKNPFRTVFAAIDGIDFSGKSEAYERVRKVLSMYHKDVPIRYSKEPDRNRLSGAEIYLLLEGKHPQYKLEDMSPSRFQAYYIRDRMYNYRYNILPALFSGQHDLQDRCMASSFAYGAEGPGDFSDFMGMHELIFDGAGVEFIWPDKIIIVDVPVEVALDRATRANRLKDKLETKEKLLKARAHYLEFARCYPNCEVIDGNRDPQEVFIDVKRSLFGIMGIRSVSGTA